MTDADTIIAPRGTTSSIAPRGTTPGGLPYPEDTDAVMAGAQAIKALAQAIDARPWINFWRWTAGTLGSAADALLQAWDLQESNFTIGDPNGGGGGFLAPKAGLYHVIAFSSFVNQFPSGNPQFSVGVKCATSGYAIASQSGEQATSNNQRRDYTAAGLIRAALGERVYAFQNNYQGISGLTYAGGTAPNRYASRFQAFWVAP